MDKQIALDILTEIGVSFKESSKGVNFSCLICGDSKRSIKKKRGWVLLSEDRAQYYCFNCSANMSFQKFLKEYYSEVYFKYIKTFGSKMFKSVLGATKATELPNDEDLIVQDLKYIYENISFPIYSTVNGIVKKTLQLKALRYLKSRSIPIEKIKEMSVCFGNYLDPQTLIPKYYLKNRIIIPYFCGDKVYTFQARALQEGHEPKYITIKEENKTKIYNYFSTKKNELVFILEGPIDSFFLPNAIATSGTISASSDAAKLIKNKFSNRIWVFDNYYKDEAGKRNIFKFVKAGEKCFNWVSDWSDCKDINDVVMKKGLTSEQITEVILNNIIDKASDLIKLKLRG